MPDLGSSTDLSELNNLLSSYFQLDTITKINYNQYIGNNGNEQWCFQSDLYLRSRNNRTLVSLFSKELWCFSLNDEPVPLPYDKNESFEDTSALSFVDSDVIDSSIIQERIPDKIGHFTPNFAKPNLPTPYAIFLKAVRRLIYLNLCSLSLNKYISFGNSCLVEDKKLNNEYRILNFSPHLFEDGSLSVSINYKNLNLISLKRFIEEKASFNNDGENSCTNLNKNLLDSYAVYIAPSSVKCTIQFTSDMLDSCTSKRAPKNSEKILKILSISHGLDLIERKDDIKWIKVVPSILYLSGQTPPIYAYLKDNVEENNNNMNAILWPLDLIYLQQSDSLLSNSQSIKSPELNIEDSLQMVNEISELNSKLTLNSRAGTDNNLLLNDDESVADIVDGISTNIPLFKNSVGPQQSSPFLMPMSHGSPDKLNPITKSMFSISNMQQTNSNGVNINNNQITSPFFRLKSMENSPAFGLIEKELFKNTDPNKSLNSIISEGNVNNSPHSVSKDENDEVQEPVESVDVDDEMRDLFGDEDEDEEENGEQKETEQFDNEDDFKHPVPKQEEENPTAADKKIGKKRAFDLLDFENDSRKSTGDSYYDPGAPIPATLTPHTVLNGNTSSTNGGISLQNRDRRSSVYSHINFNPLIESVDSKYKQGGKFAMSFFKANGNDHLFADDEHNHNTGDNESTPDEINLQEIMFQATRNIKQDRREDEEYNDDVSSDEDDNGMISIRDITNTNPSIPITSISHSNFNNTVSQNKSSNIIDGYQSLPYTNIFTNNNNNNSSKANGNFPLSVINELNNTGMNPKDLKNLVYPLSVPSSGLLSELSSQSNLLSGNELYKKQIQLKPLSSVLLTTNHNNAGLGQGENQNTDILDNLMAKISSPTLVKHSTSALSPDGNNGKMFIDEIILSDDSKAHTLDEKKDGITTINREDDISPDEEDKNVNVLPFVLRHMPVFSIPFHFYTDPNNKIVGLNSDLFLETFERELVFNCFLSEFEDQKEQFYGQDNSFYEPAEDVERIFHRLFPRFHRLNLGKDMLTSDKLLPEIIKERNSHDIDKCIIVSDYEGKELLIDNDVLSNWSQFDIKPVEIPKMRENERQVYACFINTFENQNIESFMNNFKYTYENRKFGKVSFVSETENGVFTVDTFNENYLTVLPLKIINYFVGIVKKTDLLVLLPVKDRDGQMKEDMITKLKFFTKLKGKILEKLPLLSLNLQLVPQSKLNFINLNELNQMALSVFNKININQEHPETYFAILKSKDNAGFKSDIIQHNYSVPIVTNNNIPYFNVPKNNKFDNYIIISYSRSIDKKYITCSWILPNGTNFSFKTWKLDDSFKFEKVCDEIWEKTIQMISKYSSGNIIGDSNCIILTRLNSILPDDELMHWRRLSSKNKNVSLAVVCVGLNYGKKDNISKPFNCEVKPVFEKNVHFTIFKNSLPLSNSQHRCSIKTGAILQISEESSEHQNLSRCDYLEINLLNCPHSSSSILLETIMWQYYELSLLNPSFGISHETVIPFNLLIIEKVLNKVIHLDI